MKIIVTSILVNDQEKAKKFYTEKLGFKVKHDIPMGEFRWLTVTEEQGSNPVEIVLEPTAHPASKPYQAALYDDGIPLTMLGSDDLDGDFARLKAAGVSFKQEPTDMGDVRGAIIDDTCGNWIMLAQAK